MLLPHNTMVVVADGRTLSLFRNAGTEAELRLEAVAGPALGSGGRGSGGRHRSAAANPDESRLAEDGYAAAVAGWLNQEVVAGRILRLFVIATPRTLGELRLHYRHELKTRLAGEVARELSGRSIADIAAAVSAAR